VTFHCNFTLPRCPSQASLVFQLLQNVVTGAISVNCPRDMRFASMLIASGKAVEPERLADTTLKLQDMCRERRVERIGSTGVDTQ